LGVLFAEAVARAGARGEPRRAHGPPPGAPAPRRLVRAGRGALSGRRPRG